MEEQSTLAKEKAAVLEEKDNLSTELIAVMTAANEDRVKLAGLSILQPPTREQMDLILTRPAVGEPDFELTGMSPLQLSARYTIVVHEYEKDNPSMDIRREYLWTVGQLVVVRDHLFTFEGVSLAKGLMKIGLLAVNGHLRREFRAVIDMTAYS